MIDPQRPDFTSVPHGQDRPQPWYAPILAAVAPESNGASSGRPVVTVVTPYFNAGPEFAATARCVLNQSLRRIEWIIVNDGSTDPEALERLRPFRTWNADRAILWPAVRVIDHRVNHGLAATRNRGYLHARADLVFQLDADDLIEPTTLEKCAWYLHTHPEAGFVKGKTVGFAGDRYLWDKGFHDGAAMLDENLATATAMVRRSVHVSVGGFDETMRGGMEDWDFWIRCASRGVWGATINEYLDWYRRRPTQDRDWADLTCDRRQARFRQRLRERYPDLTPDNFPTADPAWHMPMESVRECAPFDNLVPRTPGKRRLLMVIPWMRMGGADRFNLDLIRSLTSIRPEDRAAMPERLRAWAGLNDDAGWEVTIATTVWAPSHGSSPVDIGNEWRPEFSRFTHDLFLSHNYVRRPDTPAFLSYLIRSRRPDVVLLTNSRLGYGLLPALRAQCPAPLYVDFNHMEEPHWRNGGHPRTGAAVQEQLDLSITVSDHLRRWMIDRGAHPRRTHACYINADTRRWRPDAKGRADVDRELGLDPASGVPVILYAARLCDQKQPLVFVESIRLLREMVDPSWRQRMESFSRERGTFAERVEHHLRQEDAYQQALREARQRRAAAKRAGADDAQVPLPVRDPIARPATPFVALVAGDGELEGPMREAISRAKLEESGHVIMLGAVRTDSMPAYMAASDIFFMPSKWEGIALSIYEAMASGLAVVGADVGGQSELVTPDTGILLPAPDKINDKALEARGYAYTLAGLLADPARRAALAAAARERIVQNFELSNMRNRMLELFALADELRLRDPRQPIPPRLALEMAATTIELLRVEDVADGLWAEKHGGGGVGQGSREDAERRRHFEEACRRAQLELAELERSRAWRLVQSLKNNPLYDALARARWGADWRTAQRQALDSIPPTERLARVRGSRAYRVIVTAKSSSLVRACTGLIKGRQ